MDFAPIILTLKLATVTTACLLLVASPLAWWLSRTRSWARPLVQSMVGMPLVLPPTVLGFYFLLVFSPNGGVGGWLSQTFDLRLVFSFPGLVVASMVYSLPFMVHPIQAGLEALPKSIIEASSLMGKSRWETLWRIELPNIRPALLTAIVLSFAHTIGEFGVVLMIGGNIPGETRVASIAIYDEVEALNYGQAHAYSLVLFTLCFSILLVVYSFNAWSSRRLVI